MLAGGQSLFESARAEYISLSGLVLEGAGIALPPHRGLVHLETVRGAKISSGDQAGMMSAHFMRGSRCV